METKRLIDADALKQRAIRVSTVKEHCYMKAVGTHEIDKAPTIDATPVIRCKDCKHFVKEDGCSGGMCDEHSVWFNDNDFCSYGEYAKTDGGK
jgi:hypothetical protein